MRDADSQADLTAYTRRIATMPLEENDDILKAGMTLCELGCHREAQGRLKEMLERRPYEMRVLHALAMTYYNLGDYKTAVRLWGDMLRLDAGDTIAAYYRGKAQQALELSLIHISLISGIIIDTSGVQRLAELLEITGVSVLA